jgi:hypothetical protein
MPVRSATRLKSANVFSLMIDGQRLLASITKSLQRRNPPVHRPVSDGQYRVVSCRRREAKTASFLPLAYGRRVAWIDAMRLSGLSVDQQQGGVRRDVT